MSQVSPGGVVYIVTSQSSSPAHLGNLEFPMISGINQDNKQNDNQDLHLNCIISIPSIVL